MACGFSLTLLKLYYMKKMKRCVLLLMSVAALAGACNNETSEETLGYQPSAEPIAFDVVAADALTRATGEIVSTEALKASDQGFGVFACYTGNLQYEYTSVQPDFMYNQQVKWAASASA